MKITGIICEYNPFHNGHAKQIAMMKEAGPVVCLMSGNFVQRGEPAVMDKFIRARAAVACGADLVLELPVTYALRSAEGFGYGGVEIFHRLGCVDRLCFGSEEGDITHIMSTAKILLWDQFSERLRAELKTGASFPTARQNALEALGGAGKLLENPNDILGVEYCKALLRLDSGIEPVTIRREGSYHESTDRENPSASMLREGQTWQGYVPENALDIFEKAPKYSLLSGEMAYLARLRGMEEQAYEMLPFGSEGLWRKLMQSVREQNTLEEIVAATKSKRYTRTRLMRMITCAYLGITREMLESTAPYVRALAMNEQGRKLLRRIRDEGRLPVINAGETPCDRGYFALECRAGDLYALCAEGKIPDVGSEKQGRVYIQK